MLVYKSPTDEDEEDHDDSDLKQQEDIFKCFKTV